MLYNECKRLKRFINILTNKDSDEDRESEINHQLDEEISKTFDQLTSTNKNKKSKLEKLLNENDRITKMLEDSKKENEELKNKLKEPGEKQKKKTTIIKPSQIGKFAKY